MSDNDNAAQPTRARGRGRGKSRGGLGKYLRARGRGHRGGRPAVWNARLVLEGEQRGELDEEEAKELEQKYSRRDLGSNADRYVEPEPELDSEGEEIIEPDVDISSFLERQRLSPQPSSAPPPPDDDVDLSLVQQNARSFGVTNSKKGKVHQVEWDAELEELSREKATADASRDLKARFRAQASVQRGRGSSTKGTSRIQRGKFYVEAPALPSDDPKPEKSEKEDMQDFLDDLLG